MKWSSLWRVVVFMACGWVYGVWVGFMACGRAHGVWAELMACGRVYGVWSGLWRVVGFCGPLVVD
jgi:hypothetical protein